jgi:hypothetical protein
MRQRSAGPCPVLAILALITPLSLNAESLRYNIKWPSGLTLGEANLSTELTTRGTVTTLDLDASLPGFTVRDHYTSSTTAKLCTIQFERETQHGPKRANERIIVNAEGKITRETLNGGTTDLPTTACPHDALSLLAALRRDPNQLSQTVLFASGYPVRFEKSGPQTITLNDKPTPTDKFICILTLPKTGDYRLELFFLKDAAHTPALIRAPFVLGTFTMELIR